MIFHVHLHTNIVMPVLNDLDFDRLFPEVSYIRAALLHGTIAAESIYGTYLVQLNNGPALGIGQMEPVTHDDIWKNWLQHRRVIAGKVAGYLAVHPQDLNGMKFSELAPHMIWNLKYAVAMMACHYRRVPDLFPSESEATVFSLAEYWKKHYNTHKGRGTVTDFVAKWERAKLHELYPSIPIR